MGWISWIVLGLIAGALGKLVMPGKDPGGFIITILLGIGGAIVGGWIGSQLGIATPDGFSLKGIAVATGGAVVILAIYRGLKGRK
ncbi:GlsB/YeaQ/YmgE family stress response membrane protein [Sinimarinibacterium sp. NLF-5-8]|uniref:GlsB/YeaQ/YmgE family stress response membrane protein n=1 Tax=Sinimarinibacterium sp. NLF-5-8 TaxID=2698684 RepID=UPI00137BD259|nr:GlsB/YeaQ/YmgE family stress response membrane protein [Sinimarinibacterium sp. NLF-5-8]QHS09467.1 GlsB/YeaQ/YmgE family stress response membrane protein [Sinimarinibacterium sp. NLF-5-8]